MTAEHNGRTSTVTVRWTDDIDMTPMMPQRPDPSCAGCIAQGYTMPADAVDAIAAALPIADPDERSATASRALRALWHWLGVIEPADEHQET